MPAALQGPGIIPHLKPVKRALVKTDSIGKSVLMSPIIVLAVGIVAATGSLKRGREHDGKSLPVP